MTIKIRRKPVFTRTVPVQASAPEEPKVKFDRAAFEECDRILLSTDLYDISYDGVQFDDSSFERLLCAKLKESRYLRHAQGHSIETYIDTTYGIVYSVDGLRLSVETNVSIDTYSIANPVYDRVRLADYEYTVRGRLWPLSANDMRDFIEKRMIEWETEKCTKQSAS